MARSRRMAVALAVATLLTTGCGVAAAPADTPTGAGSAMCAPEAPDCEDTGTDDAGDDASDDDHRARARALLGTVEAELPDDVRVGRRGDEQMMLTEDHRVGRLTVELDPDDDGTFVVTSVTVELQDGPETVHG